MFNHRPCSLIGMIHALPLPGSSHYGGSMDTIISAALRDAQVYQECGADALLVENMHDTPYLNGYVEPETTAALSVLCHTLKMQCNLPMGIQVLAGANLEALGIAVACRLDFMRVEGFVYAHVGDEGLHQSCAATLVRRRSQLKAEHIAIYADIKKKHSSHSITADTNIAETACAAEFFRADGVIVTGVSTGRTANLEELKAVRQSTPTKVLVGSGITAENLKTYAPHCDAVIVGTSCKQDGIWQNPVDSQAVARLVESLKS